MKSDTTYTYLDDYHLQHTVRLSDFNGDDAVDTLSYYDSSGSGFGGRFIRLVNGKTGAIVETSTYGCFCEIRREVFFPKDLDTSFRQAIEALLPKRRPAPDGSLAWIIHGLFNRKKIEGNGFFKEIIPFPNTWKRGPVEPPFVYSVKMGVDSLLFLHVEGNERETLPAEKASTGCLLYYGHNHFDQTIANPADRKPERVATTSDYQIYKTQHGLIAQKDGAHKWIFATDIALTGAPEKLRWPSIGEVKAEGPYVFLEQVSPTDETSVLWVIDVENGVCGRSTFSQPGNALSSAQISSLKEELSRISN